MRGSEGMRLMAVTWGLLVLAVGARPALADADRHEL